MSPTQPVWFFLVVIAMYILSCRVIRKELMEKARVWNVFLVFWAVGILVFGLFMQLIAPDNPITVAIFATLPLAALALALNETV